jgi:hypothetical protein
VSRRGSGFATESGDSGLDTRTECATHFIDRYQGGIGPAMAKTLGGSQFSGPARKDCTSCFGTQFYIEM